VGYEGVATFNGVPGILGILKVLEILEDFLRWLVFFSGDPLGPLFYVLRIHLGLARLGAEECRQKKQGCDDGRALVLHASRACMRCAKATIWQRLDNIHQRSRRTPYAVRM
jgi:hypothetical protein